MIEAVKNKLIKNGYVTINNVINKRVINSAKKIINNELKLILKKKRLKTFNSITKNFLNCKKIFSQHHLQVILAKKLETNGIYHSLLSEKKIVNILVNFLGPDIEYETSNELAINITNVKDDYYLKKYHQEYWSGVGISCMLLWIPLNLKSNMGSIEVIKESHKWGHIPHKNREPVHLPNNYKSENIKITEGSVVLFTPLTIHRTVPNKSNEIRIALPISVRNWYYPKSGNEDLWEYKKLQTSFYSKFRKILGNKEFSPFRTLGETRKSIFEYEKLRKL